VVWVWGCYLVSVYHPREYRSRRSEGDARPRDARQPCSPHQSRWELLYRGLLHDAWVDIARIAEEEIAAAGWDRSEYRKG
jgi:hypothetical protein